MWEFVLHGSWSTEKGSAWLGLSLPEPAGDSDRLVLWFCGTEAVVDPVGA